MHDAEAVKRYKNRREARLGIATTHSYDSVAEYRKRRAERMGLNWEDVKREKRFRKSKDGMKLEKSEIRKGLIHLDAPDEEEGENNNNRGGGGRGGHGNTRLPFGLCQRFGIEIGADWTPKDAWDALAGKGISADGAYARLKKGEDPGIPDDGDSTPVDYDRMRKVSIAGDEYIVKEAERKKDGGATGKPWVLMGSLPDHKDVVGELASFETKKELFMFLKEQGVEEFPDPETGELLNPKEMEFSEDPVKTFKVESLGGAEYGDLRGSYSDYYGRGADKWRVRATKIEGSGDGSWAPSRKSYSFHTRMDMYEWLKNNGIEEFADPQTGEIINPQEMEFPEKLFGWAGVGYTALMVSLKSGQYSLVATDYDGKKRTLDTYPSLSEALARANYYGVLKDDIKLSPAVKKREVERKAWLTSGKKEWIERDGVRYGDLRAEKDDSGRYMLQMSSEGDVRKEDLIFSGRMELIKYLKEQGVERAKIDKEFVNPQDYEIPETVARINKRDYQSLYFKAGDGIIYFCGKDLDGVERELDYLYRTDKQTFEEFKESCLGGGLSGVVIDESRVTIDDEAQKEIEKKQEEDRAREIRKAEFESKAMPFRGRKWADMSIEKSPYGHGEYSLYGYDEDGDRRRILYGEKMGKLIDKIKDEDLEPDLFIKSDEIREAYEKYQEFDKNAVMFGGGKYVDLKLTKDSDGDYIVVGTDETGTEKRVASWYRDMHSAVEAINTYSSGMINPEELIKDEEIKKEYDDYKKRTEEFESKAVSFYGRKYADISIVGKGGEDYYTICGYDIKGRPREIESGRYKDIRKTVEDVGLSFEELPMDDEAKRRFEKHKKEEEGIASGEYLEYKGHAYKDFHVATTYGGEWGIIATDINGEQKSLVSKSYDDIIDELESNGITSYDILSDDRKTKIGERPKNGIRKVRLMRTTSGEFKVMATTGKGTAGQVYSTASEEDARKWLRDNGVDDTKISTKGMNPNDDVPRTHTAKSLANYDKHRLEREDDYPLLRDMSADQKQEVVDMMTDVFDQGEFRMWREGHFEEIVMGGFKNTLETGTSGGATGDSRRRYTEKEMFGLKGHRAGEGEKYGYAGFADDLDAFESRIARGYGGYDGGGFLYRFKKDAVGDRTTYTAGDSLDSSISGDRDRPLAGYAGSKPTYEGVSAMRPENFKKVMKEYKRYKDGEIGFNEFLEYFSGRCQDGYVECQYHDKLTIEDVDSVTARKDTMLKVFKNMSDKRRKEVIEKLKNSGVQLQVYDGVRIQDGYEFLREELGLE